MSPFLELWPHSIVQSCEDYHFEKWPKAYFQEIIDELPECFGSQNLTQNWRICGACNTLQGSSWHNLLLIFFSFLDKGHRGVIKQSLEKKSLQFSVLCFPFKPFRDGNQKDYLNFIIFFCGSSSKPIATLS